MRCFLFPDDTSSLSLKTDVGKKIFDAVVIGGYCGRHGRIEFCCYLYGRTCECRDETYIWIHDGISPWYWEWRPGQALYQDLLAIFQNVSVVITDPILVVVVFRENQRRVLFVWIVRFVIKKCFIESHTHARGARELALLEMRLLTLLHHIEKELTSSDISIVLIQAIVELSNLNLTRFSIILLRLRYSCSVVVSAARNLRTLHSRHHRRLCELSRFRYQKPYLEPL